MLTPLTQIAIILLNDIRDGEFSLHSRQYTLCPYCLTNLLERLERAGLILSQQKPGMSHSYELRSSYTAISLLDLLKATGEHLECHNDITEEMYLQYGVAARKLGVINHITRRLLSEITLIDLPTINTITK